MNEKYLIQLKLKTETFCELPETKLESSMSAYTLLRDYIWDFDSIDVEESLYVVFLNPKNKLIGFSLISIGTLTNCTVDVAKIVKLALLCNATQIIVSHNHPSGNREPSKADEIVTERLSDALSLFNIGLIDHIIITKNNFYSFADELKLPSPLY